ncbi:ArsR family transcriptional regulator [Candidatus Woesearchaeota archaeon]|nr:MAG: ArsR family transcriptional regulator [Candidatus Woesearchaeota archaeon]
MEYCLFFDKATHQIKDFWPKNLDEETKNKLTLAWQNSIMREILLALSEHDELTTPELKKIVGHSMSTLHENIEKLKRYGLIEAEMTYVGNKKKVLRSRVLCVTRNPRLVSKLKNFLNKGLWVDSRKSKKIISFLDQHPNTYFSVPEIAAKTKIPADEVETLLENWDSQITRALSDFLKPPPFEKKILYRSLKGSDARK